MGARARVVSWGECIVQEDAQILPWVLIGWRVGGPEGWMGHSKHRGHVHPPFCPVSPEPGSIWICLEVQDCPRSGSSRAS